MGIIYRAYLPDGRSYVGQTIQGLEKRKADHWRLRNSGNTKFQVALREYGKESFKWEVLEECSEQDLNDREIYWIEQFDSYNNGFNTDLGGGVNYVRRHPSAETKSRMGDKTRGTRITEEHRAKISTSTKGKPHSAEHIEKIRATLYGNTHMLGHKHSDETKKKISVSRIEFNKEHPDICSGKNNGMYGKQHTQEAKDKMAVAHKGKPLSEETKRKIAAARKGRHHSEETKRKMAAARVAYLEKKRSK